jgi:serine/threonine-protein kinase
VSASNPAAPEPKEIAGRYTIERKLGAGAFGNVYKARDQRLKRIVAIKTIRMEGLVASQSGLADMLERFNREATTAAALKHPGIVTIYDFGESEGLTYLAMEFIDGTGLDRVIAELGRVPAARAASLAAQVADALDYAHKHGVVHRDIKPANIMIEPGDRVKVTDFGIAKPKGEDLTATGSLLGTPSYMSPEQARGQELDGRSDLFSLGCVLYEMLAGKKAFRGDSITALLFKIISEQPPPIRELDPTVPDELAQVVAKALNKEPKTRYQSGREMSDALIALTRPGYVPTLRAIDTPTLPPGDPAAAPTVITSGTARVAGTLQEPADAITLARAGASGSTQPPAPAAPPLAPTILTPSSATAAATVPPPPLPAAKPAATPAPQRASARPAPPARKSGGGLGLVIGIGAVGVLLLAGLAFLGVSFLRRGPAPAPSPTAVADATAAPTPHPEATAESAAEPAASAEATPAAAAASVAPTPAAVTTTRPAVSGRIPPPPAPPTAPARAPADAGGAPATRADAGASEPSADYSFLDEIPAEGPDGRAAGEALAQKYRSGGSGAAGYPTGPLRARSRFPARVAPFERPAVATLAHLMFAQEGYRKANGRYGTLRELKSAGLLHLDVPFSEGGFERSRYRFQLSGGPEEYRVTAQPLGMGGRPFVVDESGYVRADE